MALAPGGTKPTRQFYIRKHTELGGRAARTTQSAQEGPPEGRDRLRPRREPGNTPSMLERRDTRTGATYRR